jgi:hypothetical protein
MKSLKNKIRSNSHINFARNCMIELITKKDLNSEISIISSSDLAKIEQILNRYRSR